MDVLLVGLLHICFLNLEGIYSSSKKNNSCGLFVQVDRYAWVKKMIT